LFEGVDIPEGLSKDEKKDYYKAHLIEMTKRAKKDNVNIIDLTSELVPEETGTSFNIKDSKFKAILKNNDAMVRLASQFTDQLNRYGYDLSAKGMRGFLSEVSKVPMSYTKTSNSKYLLDLAQTQIPELISYIRKLSDKETNELFLRDSYSSKNEIIEKLKTGDKKTLSNIMFDYLSFESMKPLALQTAKEKQLIKIQREVSKTGLLQTGKDKETLMPLSSSKFAAISEEERYLLSLISKHDDPTLSIEDRIHKVYTNITDSFVENVETQLTDVDGKPLTGTTLKKKITDLLYGFYGVVFHLTLVAAATGASMNCQRGNPNLFCHACYYGRIFMFWRPAGTHF